MFDNKEYQRKWYQKNKNKVKENVRLYREHNRSKYLAWGSEYYAKNKEEMDKASKKWRDSHKDEIKKCAKQYYVNNLDKLVKYKKQYYLDNRELILMKCIQYRRTFAGKLSRKVYHHNRRIAEKGLTRETIQQVYEDNIKKFGTLTCELCIQPCEFGQDALEHFHPISRRAEYGGDINERKNLGVAHKRCNESKGSKTLVEWIEKRRACVPC